MIQFPIDTRPDPCQHGRRRGASKRRWLDVPHGEQGNPSGRAPAEASSRRGPDRAGGSVRSALALVGALTLAVSVSTTCVLTAGLGAPQAAAATTTPVNTMYVLNNTSGSVLSFAPGATGNVAPTSTVSGPSTTLNSPYYMAMDPSGNVWVANYAANTVVEFTQSQLAVGGSPAPTVTLTSTVSNSLDHPTYVLFDRSGDLWVTNAAPGTGAWSSSRRASWPTTGSPTPTVTLTDDGRAASATPVHWPSTAKAASGSATTAPTPSCASPRPDQCHRGPDPGCHADVTGTSITTPDALAFDRSGQLWVANDTTPGSVVAFSPAQLASSGAPVPHITLSPNGHQPRRPRRTHLRPVRQPVGGQFHRPVHHRVPAGPVGHDGNPRRRPAP